MTMARGGRQQRRGDAAAPLPPAPAADTAEPIAAPVAIHLASGECVATAPDAADAAGAGSPAVESMPDEPEPERDPIVAPWIVDRVAAGSTHEAARESLAVMLEPLGEQARERFSAGEPHEAVDAWYEAQVRLVLSETPAAPRRHTLIPRGYDRRRVLCHLGAWGYTDDGHSRESWSPGDVGWFQPHVYDSVPGATAPSDGAPTV